MGAFTNTFGIDGVAQSNIPISPPTFLRDGNTVAWYDASDLSTINKNDSNVVSRVNDKLGSGHDLISGTCTWSKSEGLMFNGTTNGMKTASFTYTQPEEVYLLVRQVSWVSQSRILDGNEGNTGSFYQAGTSTAEGLEMYAGSQANPVADKHPNIGPWNVIRVLYNGNTSSCYVNGDEQLNLNPGTNNMNGITLGEFGYGGAKGNVNIRHAIFRKIVDTTLNRNLLIDYLTRIANALNRVGKRTQLQTDFLSKRFGIILHWNMATFTNEEQATPNLSPSTFNPTNLNIDNWLNSIVASGAKYVFLTSKHTDGFALWDTAYAVDGYAPYCITQTSWYATHSIDIIDLFTRKCREKGLKIGLYFSMYDGTYQARRGSVGSTNDASYLAMVKFQLFELLTKYGHIDYLWLDAWGKVSTWIDFSNIAYAPVYNYIKSLDPNTLVTVNMPDKPTINGDVQTYENAIPPKINYETGERVFAATLGATWFYSTTLNQAQVSYYTSAQIRSFINLCNGRNCNFLLGLNPDRTGNLPAIQTQILAEINL